MKNKYFNMIVIILVFLYSCERSKKGQSNIINGQFGVINYDLNFLSQKLGNVSEFVMNKNGDYLYILDGEFIYRYSLESRKVKKVALNDPCENCFYDLIASQENNRIALLSFDTKICLDTSIQKQILFTQFDTSLVVLDTQLFHTQRNYHLLVEDFRYVSFYQNEQNDFMFNHDFSYLQHVKNGKWGAFSEEFSNVDLENGIIYKTLYKNDTLTILNSNGDEIKLNSNSNTYSLSVCSGDILFYSSKMGSKGVKRIRKDGKINFYKGTNFNPSYRINNGIYSFDKTVNILSVLYFE